MTQIFKNNFRFVANRWEEWQNGTCISKGAINSEIVAKTSFSSIHIELSGTENLKIENCFNFEFQGSHELNDRIQYVHGSSDRNPLIPRICHLFHQGDTISYVRFVMINPDRMIEFYGSMVELGQKSSGHETSLKIVSKTSAEQVIRELQSYDGLSIEALMEHAINMYDPNDDLLVIESLKLFVKANELDGKLNDTESSISKPLILRWIALCNFTIGNAVRAYCIAKQGLEVIEEVIDSLKYITIPKSRLGADTLNEIINIIEESENGRRYISQVDDHWYIDPNEIVLPVSFGL